MAISFLSIGSNLGDRLAYLSSAVTALGENPNIEVLKVSSVYQTKPIGGPEQDDYLNAVIKIETKLPPNELLEFTQNIEKAQQRVRDVRWGPRTLDIDILTYADLVSADETLTLPHPRISERAFVLIPWHEIEPTYLIPEFGELEMLYKQISKSDVQLNSAMKLPRGN